MAGGCLLAAFALDYKIRDLTQRHLAMDNKGPVRLLYNVGTIKYAVPSLVALAGLAMVTEDQVLYETVLLSMQALLITHAVNFSVNSTISRDRPCYYEDGKKGEKSFFSGHAAGAWTVAAVVADQYSDYKWLAYGLASLISFSRLMTDTHWASDVVAGSLVGYGIGRITVRLNHDRGVDKWALSSVVGQDITGLVLHLNY